MSFAAEFAPQAKTDLLRLFPYLLDRIETVEELHVAQRAIAGMEMAAQVHLSRTPFIYCEAAHGDGLRRERTVPFGASGYVLLEEIAGPAKVVVLAVRHQLEQDLPLRKVRTRPPIMPGDGIAPCGWPAQAGRRLRAGGVRRLGACTVRHRPGDRGVGSFAMI